MPCNLGCNIAKKKLPSPGTRLKAWSEAKGEYFHQIAKIGGFGKLAIFAKFCN
jgi:hypothetical protein